MKKRIFTVALALLLALTIVTPASAEEPPDGYYHYVGPWVWWPNQIGRPGCRPPPNSISWIDLRSTPEMSQQGGTPQGYGFFITTEPVTLPGYVLVSRFFSDEYPLVIKTALQSRYSMLLEAYTTRGLIWEMFIQEGDPTGL